MMVRSIKPEDWAEWLRMRLALWPHHSKEEHEAGMSSILQEQAKAAVFVAQCDEGRLGGFIEVSLRPFAEGSRSSPVGYIEGWYVEPAMRRTGVGRQLIEAGEEWTRSKGCFEMASDTQMNNEEGQIAHRQMGYKEVERLVHLIKDLRHP